MSISQSSNEAVLPEELVDCVKVSVASVFEKSFGYVPSFQKDDEETPENRGWHCGYHFIYR